MTIHYLKSLPKQFVPTWFGLKTADLRVFDRPFEVGDAVVLQEFTEEHGFTGRELFAQISHIISTENQCALSRQAIDPKYCILSLQITGRKE